MNENFVRIYIHYLSLLYFTSINSSSIIFIHSSNLYYCIIRYTNPYSEIASKGKWFDSYFDIKTLHNYLIKYSRNSLLFRLSMNFFTGPWAIFGACCAIFVWIFLYFHNFSFAQNCLQWFCSSKRYFCTKIIIFLSIFYELCQHRELCLNVTATKTKTVGLRWYYFDHTVDSARRVLINVYYH